jgi:hypothetical protein
MKGTSYRLPVAPIVPGTDHKGEGFRILESMPVKSLITSPADGTRPPAGTRELNVRGHAWAGDLTVQDVFVSIDFGQTWQQSELKVPVNRYAWQRWSTKVALPTEGYYEIWALAVDSEGKSQPFAAPNWNPGGYGGNAYHALRSWSRRDRQTRRSGSGACDFGSRARGRRPGGGRRAFGFPRWAAS